MNAHLSHVTDHTLRGLVAIEQAARCLLDYREPGTTVTGRERVLLADKIGRGYSPADAAEAVQAEAA